MDNKIKIENYLLVDSLISNYKQPKLMNINYSPCQIKIFKYHFILHTFASRIMPTQKPKLAKECNFPSIEYPFSYYDFEKLIP